MGREQYFLQLLDRGNYMIVGGDPGDDRNDIDINNPETIQCLEVYKALNQFFLY